MKYIADFSVPSYEFRDHHHLRGNAVGRATDLRLTCRGFESWLGTIAQWSWASYLHLRASVTKQYNLVPAKGVITLAGKVTVGLVESNGNILPGL